jgi:hypothetical protein
MKSRLITLVVIVVALAVPASAQFPLWGGVGGQFHKHAGLTAEMNQELKWQIIRWEVSSWVIDSIGWAEFRDSLLNRLNPPGIKILLQLRWNAPSMHPASLIQHCVPQNWEEWRSFCREAAVIFSHDNVWFQIGNEPDFAGQRYWNGTIPQFIEYVNFGAQAIKDANPDAYVVCGGFTGGCSINSTIRQVVDGLSVNVDALDRHFYGLNKLSAELLNECLTVWPNFCHQRHFDCFVSELSPPCFCKAREGGIDCAMFFDLWGSSGGRYAAVKDGVPTELGKSTGTWIGGQIEKEPE